MSDQEQQNQVENLIVKYGLQKGKEITFVKTKIMTESSVPVGTEMKGILLEDVSIGKQIFFEDSPDRISAVNALEERDDGLYIVTDTSKYVVS